MTRLLKTAIEPMTDQHLITPPDDLIQSWVQDHWGIYRWLPRGASKYMAAQAAQWGAEQQHKISRDFLDSRGFNSIFLEDLTQPFLIDHSLKRKKP